MKDLCSKLLNSLHFWAIIIALFGLWAGFSDSPHDSGATQGVNGHWEPGGEITTDHRYMWTLPAAILLGYLIWGINRLVYQPIQQRKLREFLERCERKGQKRRAKQDGHIEKL